MQPTKKPAYVKPVLQRRASLAAVTAIAAPDVKSVSGTGGMASD